MNTRLLSGLSILLIGTALCLYQATAQQEAETPADQVVSPTDSDANEIPANETADAAPEELETPSPAEEAFQRAMQHEEKNEIEEALEDCTEAIRLDPNNLEYLNGRAHLYGEMRDKEKAMTDAAKVLELDPTNLRARVLRGRMLELTGDLEKALIEFNTAVEQNPTSVQALSERQYYFLRQRQDDKAMADADRMVQLQPDSAAGNVARALSGNVDQMTTYSSAAIQQNLDNWFAYKLRGLSRAVNGDFAGAMSDFDKALELSPNNARVFSARGAMYYMQGDYGKSLADAQKAADLEPRNCSIIALLADRLATCPDSNLRDSTKASQYAAEALKLDPNELLVWRACASAAAANGNFDEAKKWQERVLNSNVLSPDQKAESQERLLAYNSGKPYVQEVPPPERDLVLDRVKKGDEAIKNGNFDRAIAVLSEAIAADPSDWVPYYGRGLSYSRQKKYDLALADLNVAIHLKPEDVDSYSERGFVLKNLGQYNQALTDFLKAESFDKNDKKGVKNGLAWLLATSPDDRVRDSGRAAEFVDAALQFHPDDAPTWDTCAAVFAGMGDFEDAIEWEKAYLDENNLDEGQRTRGEKRLALYREHRPYREEPEKGSNQLTASTTPAQPEK